MNVDDVEQGDDDWEPPTETEMKVIQARRERSDKVSKLMGDYLLKGYRMLGVCCRACDTILLQDKQGNNYCVACRELDADNIKDDPALSDEAALRQAAEHNQRSIPSSQHNSPEDNVASISGTSATGNSAQEPLADAGPHLSSMTPDLTRNVPRAIVVSDSVAVQESRSVRPKTICSQQPAQLSQLSQRASAEQTIEDNALLGLYGKLQAATAELTTTQNINHSIELCQLLKNCAEAIEALRKMQKTRQKVMFL